MGDDVLPRIVDRVHARRERFVATHDVDILPPPEVFPNETVIVGGYTRITMTTRLRFRLKEVLLSVDHTQETPSALAKDYLKVVYKTGPRVTSVQGQTINASVGPHPLYATPCEFEQGFYIDIASCYWSIMDAVGWDVDYFPGKWLGIGRAPFDFPWQQKGPARNCLVSCSTSEGMLVSDTTQGLHIVKSFNPLLNKSLYLLINDVLNAIAKQAIRIGAIYVHTDGFICPDEATAQALFQLVADWGLEARVKARGRGFVLDSQTYRVGDMRTKNVGPEPRDEHIVKDVPHASWLQRKMSWAASVKDVRII